jgi:GST-like protein
MALPYEQRFVNILEGESFAPPFVAINANARIPALVDHTPIGERIVIVESGAILQCLGRKSGRLYASDAPQWCRIDSWVFWQMSSLGPMTGQITWFIQVGRRPDHDPRDYLYPIKRYK